MSFRTWLLIGVAVAIGLKAGETSRKPEDYPAHLMLGNVTLGAENLGPSVPSAAGGIFTHDYLCIDVGLFAPGIGQRVNVAHPSFALRINGSKSLLRPDTPGAVAASIKYPDWEERGHLEAVGGVGDAQVVLGRPRQVERFPGDHRPAEQQPSGPIPRVENPVSRKADPTSIEERVQHAALPEGEGVLPVSGCLYFPFKGKLKSIKKLELLYEGPLGEGSLRIP